MYPLSVSPSIAKKSAKITDYIECTWEDFCAIEAAPDGKAKEEYELLYPARFENSYRTDDNARDLWAARIDVDQRHVTEEELRKALTPFKAVAWTSYNSTPEALRWAVWVVLDRTPAYKAEYQATVRRLVEIIPGASKGQADMSRPRVVPVDRPGFRKFVTDGFPLAVALVTKEPAHQKSENPLWERAGKPDIQKAREIRRTQGYPPQGEQYDLSRLLARALVDAGYDEGDACSMVSADGDYDTAWIGPVQRSAVAGGESLKRYWPAAEEFLNALGIERYGTTSAKTLIAALRAREAVVETPAKPGHEYTYDPSFVVNGEVESASLHTVTTTLISSAEWQNVLKWNDFSNRPEAHGPPMKLDAEQDKGVSKNDITLIRLWFAWRHGMKVREEDCRAAIYTATKRNHYHPVQIWLNALPEADPRILDGLAGRLFGASDPLEEVFLRKFLVQAVARIMRPGCQADSALTLYEERGGMKKSTFVRVLFGEAWMAPFGKMKLGEIETSRKLLGKWAFEIAEMAAMRDSQVEDIKAFFTTTSDHLRDMWDPNYWDQPRQCVFVCTTNDKQILKDEAHERRFWIIDVKQVIDIEYLEANRDAIWRAALDLYRAGEQWWLTNEEKERAKIILEGFREQPDPWHEAIEDYCSGKEYVLSSKMFTDLFAGTGGGIEKYGVKEQRRICISLKRMGCVSCTMRTGDKVIRVWRMSDKLRSQASPQPEPKLRLVLPTSHTSA